MKIHSGAPTLGDVARLAGVSPATASRVINNGTAVNDDKRRAVEQAVAKLGYVPNHLARALATQRAGVVALLLPETNERVFSDPFFSQLYQGALQGFAGSTTRVVLSISQPGDKPDAMARYLDSGHLDGAIVASHHGHHIAQQLHDTGRPVIFIGEPGLPEATYVDIDQEDGVKQAVNHLVGRGARAIATITGPQDMLVGRRRLQAFRDTLADHALTPAAVVEGAFTRESGAAAARQLLDSGTTFDALFVASDLMALGALRVLKDAGITVPQDLLLASFDNSVLAIDADPPLTTVDNPAQMLAEQASHLLRRRLAGEETTTPVILRTELHIRASA